MDDDAPLTQSIIKKWHGTYKSYLIGGLSSFLLTGAAFLIVWKHLLTKGQLHFLLFALAITQAFVQLQFLLHLGKESKPYFKVQILFLMLTTLVIIVLGSLWIMSSLDKRVMTM